jgi:hypothetical protein
LPTDVPPNFMTKRLNINSPLFPKKLKKTAYPRVIVKSCLHA